jgi:hypothetical protein
LAKKALAAAELEVEVNAAAVAAGGKPQSIKPDVDLS